MRSYVVIGLGLFGSEAAISLTALGCDVLAVDVHPDVVQQVAQNVPIRSAEGATTCIYGHILRSLSNFSKF